MKTISFNKVWLTGNEKKYITQALSEGKTCGNGNFTHKCQSFFEEKLGSCKCLLTTSCTDALEMCAMLAGIQPGDEVIVPSYTFVSTALAFVRQGARIVFADSRMDNPCIDEQKLEAFLSLSLRGYCVPEDELQKVLQFIAGMDIRAISEKVMQDLFQALAMRYDFTLPETV